jgi:membrane-bound ClpP family serine protease
MSDNKIDVSGGIGVSGLLGVAFVVLKLTGYINWSWWWVTLPFWGGLALVLGGLAIFFGVLGLIVLVAGFIDKIKGTKKKEPTELEKERAKAISKFLGY